jgi:hypothetical protein
LPGGGFPGPVDRPLLRKSALRPPAVLFFRLILVGLASFSRLRGFHLLQAPLFNPAFSQSLFSFQVSVFAESAGHNRLPQPTTHFSLNLFYTMGKFMQVFPTIYESF